MCTRVSVRWQQIVSVSFEFWGLLKKKAPQTLCSQSFRQAHFCKDGRKTDVFWTKIGALNGRKDGRISQIDGQNHKNTGIRRAIFHKCPSIDTIGYTACISFSIENLHFLSRNQWLLTTSTIITYLVSPVKKVPNMISHRSNDLHFSHSFVYVCHCYIPRPC